jgi:hypothetical protein
MKNQNSNPHNDRPIPYQIKVRGRLDESWSDWLEGMAITFDRDSDGSDLTILTGQVVDQAALHGVLNRIRDLNAHLLSVHITNPNDFGKINHE